MPAQGRDDKPLRRVAAGQRQQLLATEQQYTNAIRGAFTVARVQLSPHVAVFTDAYGAKLQQVRAASGNPQATVPSTWLADRTPGGGNVAGLQRFVQVQVDGFGAQAKALIGRGTRQTATQGNDDAQALLHAALSPAQHLVEPDELVHIARGEAKQALIEQAITPASKLNTLLGGLGAEAADRVHKNLLQGLAAGVHPRQVADLIYSAVGRSASRALTVARTEMIGAYRDAALDNYRRNDDVVQQWVWSAELLGCCPLCCAMNGTIHSLDEPMDSHACCRCTPLPVTKSWDDILGPLGIDASDLEDTRVQVESGEDWFARQPEAVQREKLGPAKYALYADGQLQLADLVGQTPDGYRYEKSLRELGYSSDQVTRLVNIAKRGGPVELIAVSHEPLPHMPEHEPVMPVPPAPEQAPAPAEMSAATAATPATSAVTTVLDGDVLARARTLLGRDVTPEELAGLVGAPTGATVMLSGGDLWDGSSYLRFGLFGPNAGDVEADPLAAMRRADYYASRALVRGADGTLVMHNDLFTVREQLQGSGLGTKVFADEVRALAAQGVDRIETTAARADADPAQGEIGYNGYYTWARLGYTGNIPASVDRSTLPDSLKGATTVQELMTTSEGRDWWKANGTTFEGVFDLTAGSLSRQMLDAYLSEKGTQ